MFFGEAQFSLHRQSYTGIQGLYQADVELTLMKRILYVFMVKV